MGIKNIKKKDGISRRKPGAGIHGVSGKLGWNSSVSTVVWRMFSFNQTHLYDFNFLWFSLIDLCEGRRTIEKVLWDIPKPADKLEIVLGAGFIWQKAVKLQSARKLFLSDAFTASSTLPCLRYIFASMRLCIEEIFPPQWRNTSVYLRTWLVAGPQGLFSICVLTGCSVTNQLPRPHLSNQIMTHSLWTSAGHLEVPVMFYLHLTHTHTPL